MRNATAYRLRADVVLNNLVCWAPTTRRIRIMSDATPASGSYDFKPHWGFEPAPLAYQHAMASGNDIPNVSPSNPRLRMFIEAWKRLPLPVTRWLGPMLTRRLPLD
jgi:hypothetical protein